MVTMKKASTALHHNWLVYITDSPFHEGGVMHFGISPFGRISIGLLPVGFCDSEVLFVIICNNNGFFIKVKDLIGGI
jgi:hypothetical protein